MICTRLAWARRVSRWAAIYWAVLGYELPGVSLVLRCNGPLSLSGMSGR